MRIAFIGFGEVASAFTPALAARGAEVGAYDVRPRECANVRFGPLAETVRDASVVLSTVTTSAAIEAARECAPHLTREQLYVDLNATEPARKLEIAKVIQAFGGTFVEGALLGAVGVTGAKTEILLGGAHARDAERLLAGELGLNARFYSEEIGKASMFKMLRSIFSKGMEALLIEFLASAERAGLRDDLWKEVTTLFETQPFEKVALNWVRSHSGAHPRRREEVKQVAGVLRSLDIEPIVTEATERMFERSARLGLGPLATADDVIRFFAGRR
jgi:3-hydroxyisobutyrate dehydrogenase-like beta-hydroxyacid dehydrogenase